TFANQDGRTTACGQTFSDDDLIAGIANSRFTTTVCGKRLVVTNTNTGQQVTVSIEDDCPACENAESLVLSDEAFFHIGDPADGEV
ncbi:hypothetical protein BD410DRAFT_693725, partial [Rickenella mellea]